ncbi:MAG TPA: extracellular solute-binding protein [Thermoanaerobaculia bacterium]|nr:extracellular solute-binding protein [Thermoanaerobaculia bacterium]
MRADNLRARVASLLPALLLALPAACTGPEASDKVVVYTSVDQIFSEPVLRSCEGRFGLSVRAVFDTEETKSTGVLNRLIAEADHPQADVFWSGDPVRPFLLVSRGLVEAYPSAEASAIPDAFRAADGSWTGLAARARVLLVNTESIPAGERPTSIRDLADPRWRGQAAIANPLFGTTTMHVAALASAWGEDEARRFLDSLRENEVRIASSNGEVKRLVASGQVAFGLTDTDDAYVALSEGLPVEVVYPDQGGLGTLIMPTSVVLMAGAPNPAAGRRMVDCLLSAETERQLAASAAHMPLRADIDVPETVQPVSGLRPMAVDYAEVAESMERIQPWLRDWVGL